METNNIKNISKCADNLKIILGLENTKILYSGVNRLYEKYASQKIINNNLTVKKFVQNEYNNCHEETTLLKQNANSDLFEYMESMYKKTCSDNSGSRKEDSISFDKEKILERLESFLQLCIDLNNLNKGIGNMYDLYGNIANDFNRLLASTLCYIFYSDPNGSKFLLSSDFKIKNELNMFDEIRTAYRIVEKHKSLKMSESEFLEKNTYYKNFGTEVTVVDQSEKTNQNDNDDQKVLSFCIDLNAYEEINNSESIYIVALYKDDGNNGNAPAVVQRYEKSVENLIYPLCFRNRIKVLFERDIAQLLSKCYNNSYDEIKKFHDDINILHLTDLHISSKNYETIANLINTEDFKMANNIKYDLMIISGDVVQGKGTANELECNYGYARKIIEMIAKKIWIENNMLRNDWQKRIIIVPGNHDYAMMNELSAVQENRKLQYGFASTNEGSIMAKFTYYIDFIRKLQGFPIGDLIDNRLNEIRTYAGMNLSICCLNSCCKENPLRTNKVKLDKDWIDKQLDAYKIGCNKQKTNICIVHHTPGYKINYFEDKYEFKWDVINDKNIDLDELLRNFVECFKENELINEEDIDIIKNICEELHNDLLQYNESVKIKDNTNEYTSAFVSESKEDIRLSDDDKADYDLQIKKLNDEFKFKYVLGGHEHKLRKESVTNNLCDYPIKVNAGDRFYHNGINKLNYAIVRLFNYDVINKEYKDISVDNY